jgi:hypothetical protein
MNYDSLTLADVRAHAMTYINANNRDLQNSTQLYYCLKKALAEAGQVKLLTRTGDYMINGVPSAPLFLKVIIGASYIDTNASSILSSPNSETRQRPS